MKFTCENSLLTEAVNIAQKAALSKSTIPALEGILLVSGEGTIKLSCYDLELGIECEIEANIAEEGKVVLNSHILGDIIRKLPNDVLSFSVDDKLLTKIKCGLSEFTILGTPPSEFPEIPKVSGGRNLNLKQNLLKSMINQTIFAISTSDNRPILTGSFFEISNNTLKVVSVDGFRLALRSEEINNTTGESNLSFVVPGKTLSEISKIIKDNDEDINIYISNKHILFSFDNIILVSRLLDGEFLNYNNVIPKEAKITADIDVKRFIEAMERASLLINDKIKSPVICSFDYDTVKISCKSAIGNVYDEFSAKIAGGEIEIGVNNRYMLDALKACEREKVVFEMTTNLSPIVIKPMGDNSFIFIVVPMRYKNED